MRVLISVAIISLAIAIIGLSGCAGSGTDPVSPADGLTYSESSSDDPGHRLLWGIWDVGFDATSMSVTAIPRRDLLAHYDITEMILPPKCDDCLGMEINSFDPVTRILDIDITLRNKYAFTGRDVRGILYTKDFGHELRNADDWTDLWAVSGGNEINPFRAFAKDEPERAFIPGAEHTESYLIYIPPPPQWEQITFAVDASWPVNCDEPYSIENFNQTGILFDAGNSSTGVEVEVIDWQSDVDEVLIFAPEITGEASTPFTNQGGNLWMLNLVNSQDAAAGQYEFLLKATSSNSGTLPLYDFAEVTVTQSGIPTNPVDVTPPLFNITPREGCVDGDYLYIAGGFNGLGIFDITDPSDPVWVNKIEPLTSADRVAAMDGYAYIIDRYSSSTLCVYDVDPPEDAHLIATMDLPGTIYDITASDGIVYIINFGSIYIIDVETLDDPQLLTELDLSCAFCQLTDITVSGNYIYLSHIDWWYYSTGIRIYDISEPGNPAYVKHLGSGVHPGQMAISDGYMFVATDYNLQISDIDPPEEAHLVKTIETAGKPEGFSLAGDFAYVTSRNYNIGDEFLEIIDISAPESAYIVNSIGTSGFPEIAGVKDGHLILTNRYFGLEIIDVDPPESAGIVRNINQPGYHRALLEEGYLWTHNSRSVSIFDIEPIESTHEVYSHPLPASQSYAGTDSSDGYACVSGGFYSGQYYFYIYDVDPPETAYEVNSVEIASDSDDIALSGGYAYALTYQVPGMLQLEIIDIDPPESAHVVNNVELPGQGWDLAVADGYVYVAIRYSQDTGILSIIDITPPETAYIVNEVELGKYASAVAVSGEYAYVGGYSDGCHIVDIDPPESAAVVTTIITPSKIRDVDVSGDYVYIAANDDLLIYNVASVDDIFLVSNIASKGDDIVKVDVKGNYAYLYEDFYGARIIELW